MAGPRNEMPSMEGCEEGDAPITDLISRYLIHHVEENGPLDLGKGDSQKAGGAWLSDSDDPSDKRTKEEKVFDALKWISDIMAKHSISWVVSGGIAARVHGANRPLWDIDIDVLDEDLYRLAEIEEIQELLQACDQTGPERFKDENWDIICMDFYYRGQRLDFTGNTTCRFFNPKDQKWEDAGGPQIESEEGVFDDGEEGFEIPVTPLDDLLEYKKFLARDVDLKDVAQIEAYQQAREEDSDSDDF